MSEGLVRLCHSRLIGCNPIGRYYRSKRNQEMAATLPLKGVAGRRRLSSFQVHTCKTASDNVYMASHGAARMETDPSALFVTGSTDNSCFKDGRFAYVSPRQFGYDLPHWDIPEVAFLGRSNVGKSSLVNSTMNQPLARSSKQPGRTQTVNYFGLLPSSHIYFKGNGKTKTNTNMNRNVCVRRNRLSD